jgi:hypothetical protein
MQLVGVHRTQLGHRIGEAPARVLALVPFSVHTSARKRSIAASSPAKSFR